MWARFEGYHSLGSASEFEPRVVQHIMNVDVGGFEGMRQLIPNLIGRNGVSTINAG
jgi:hypothetical protein